LRWFRWVKGRKGRFLVGWVQVGKVYGWLGWFRVGWEGLWLVGKVCGWLGRFVVGCDGLGG